MEAVFDKLVEAAMGAPRAPDSDRLAWGCRCPLNIRHVAIVTIIRC
jgi:hypothetical protein